MVNIIKEKLDIEDSLKRKIDFICNFTNTKPTIINGSIRRIDKTNLTYIEPHRIIINDITFLTFNYSNEIFIENLSNKIKLSELENLERENYQYKTRYNDLKEKNDYLIYHLNKTIKKLPEFIQNLIDRLFNYNNIELKYFKQQYDPEVIEKEGKSFKFRRSMNLFNKNEINKSIKHINEEMDEAAEEFYKQSKKEDDDLSL